MAQSHEKTTLRVILSTLSLLLLVAFFLGCSKNGERASSPIRLGINSTAIASALPVIADDLGYWKEAGVTVSLQGFTAGRLALDALLRGEVDLATVAETPIALAALKGQQLAVVATISVSSYEVLARRDRGVAAPADLSGKQVATFLGTSAEFFLDTFLQRHGVSRGQVQVTNLGPTDMVSALVRGDVDAIVIWQPHIEAARRLLSERAVAFPSDDIYREYFNLVALPAYARAHEAEVGSVLRALLKAEDTIEKKPDDAIAIVARRVSVAPDLATAAWNHFRFRVSLDRDLVSLMNQVQEWAFARGITQKKPGTDTSSLLRSSPLQSLAPDRVRL